MSGYSENAIGNQGLVAKNVPFLQKPFAVGALVQKVRKLLETAVD